MTDCLSKNYTKSSVALLPVPLSRVSCLSVLSAAGKFQRVCGCSSLPRCHCWPGVISSSHLNCCVQTMAFSGKEPKIIYFIYIRFQKPGVKIHKTQNEAQNLSGNNCKMCCNHQKTLDHNVQIMFSFVTAQMILFRNITARSSDSMLVEFRCPFKSYYHMLKSQERLSMKLACHREKSHCGAESSPSRACLGPALDGSLTSPGRRQQQVGNSNNGRCSR